MIIDISLTRANIPTFYGNLARLLSNAYKPCRYSISASSYSNETQMDAINPAVDLSILNKANKDS
jgi:hypothetical protein